MGSFSLDGAESSHLAIPGSRHVPPTYYSSVTCEVTGGNSSETAVKPRVPSCFFMFSWLSRPSLFEICKIMSLYQVWPWLCTASITQVPSWRPRNPDCQTWELWVNSECRRVSWRLRAFAFAEKALFFQVDAAWYSNDSHDQTERKLYILSVELVVLDPSLLNNLLGSEDFWQYFFGWALPY